MKLKEQNIVSKLRINDTIINPYYSYSESDDARIRSKEVSSRDYLMYLENLFTLSDSQGLKKFADASYRPLVKILLVELLDFEGNRAERLKEIMEGNAHYDFICNRSAKRVDWAHDNNMKVGEFDFNDITNLFDPKYVGGNVMKWCKEILKGE